MKKQKLAETLKKEKEKAKQPEVSLVQKLAKGELIAEGRYTDVNRFENIPREAWLDFEPCFEKNELSRYPNDGIEERYLNVYILSTLSLLLLSACTQVIASNEKQIWVQL